MISECHYKIPLFFQDVVLSQKMGRYLFQNETKVLVESVIDKPTQITLREISTRLSYMLRYNDTVIDHVKNLL